MNANCKGALAEIDKSYRAFIHKGKSMTKEEVRAVLEYAIEKGYDHTGQLTDEEVDKIILMPKEQEPERSVATKSP